ncbi:MAG: hypothetical protein Q8Q41_03810 [bacterium]|nr:hypothetical protein [bacterium]
MTKTNYFRITGCIFLLIAILHLVRFFYGWEAVIGSVAIPLWISVFAAVIAGVLTYQSFRLGRE